MAMNMAPISDIYGVNFQQEAEQARCARLCDLIASNCAGLNFQLRYDFGALFNQGRPVDGISDQIIKKIQTINPKMIGTLITDQRMLPYVLATPAFYLRLFDLDRKKVYLLYVSTENMEAY